MNKSAGEFTICEDFERLNQLKCVAPESIQAQRELNHLEQIGNLTKAIFSESLKKINIQTETKKIH